MKTKPRRKKTLIADVNKFSLAQMLSNTDGKTSASGAMGVFICLVGGITFLIGSMALIFKGTDSDILVQSISLVYAGALLLGYRKSADTKEAEVEEEVEPEAPIEQEEPKKQEKSGEVAAPVEQEDVQLNS